MNTASNEVRLGRRSFIAVSGLSATFLVGCSSIPAIPKRPQPSVEAAKGWISLTPAGQWRLYCPRMEMGQNILTSLREVAAIELGINAEQIQVQLPSTRDIPLVKATVGSDSLRELCTPLAQACYALRAELMRRALLRLPNSSAESLQFQGEFVQTSAGVRIALRELALPLIDVEVKNRPTEQLRFYKTPLSNAQKPKSFAQGELIIRGQALFAADVRLPNLLYAIVLRSPWADREIARSKLVAWDEAAVRAIPGFHSIIEHPLLSGPALLSTRIGSLDRMRSVANAQWSDPNLAVPDPMQIVDVDKALSGGSFTKSKGQVQAGTWAVDMRLDVPIASHAFIEPRCAVAQPIDDGGMKLWCGTQDVFYIRDVVRRDLKISIEKIDVQAMRIGGGFGGKTIATVEREAAIIASIAGNAVKVQWSRADEFQAAFQRQPASQRIRARLDSQGRITDWQHSLSTSHVLFSNAVVPPWMQRLTNFIGDDGAARGQAPVYQFTRQQLNLNLTRIPVLTGPWRGLGAGPNVLAIEMAMDAAALVAKIDPVDFRLMHLRRAESTNGAAGDPSRVAHCLQKVSALAKSKPFVVQGHAGNVTQAFAFDRTISTQGVACGAYKGMSYAAAVAQVEVVTTSQKLIKSIRVSKLWCVHDCGRMIDALGVQAQVQGNLVWTIGMVLTEYIDASRGTSSALNFSNYAIPKITDVPPMEIDLIESAEMPSGAGETAMVAGAGAIANAVVRALQKAGLEVPMKIPFLSEA